MVEEFLEPKPEAMDPKRVLCDGGGGGISDSNHRKVGGIKLTYIEDAMQREV